MPLPIILSKQAFLDPVTHDIVRYDMRMRNDLYSDRDVVLSIE